MYLAKLATIKLPEGKNAYLKITGWDEKSKNLS